MMFEKYRTIRTKLSQIPRRTWIKWVIYSISTLGILFGLFFLSIYWGLWGEIPDKADLQQLRQNEATEIFASDGELIGKYYIFDRQPVLYEELPPHLIDALIATEDIRFYQHSGIDGRSLLRVFFKTLLLGDESSGGGSTITLQLAKNLFGRKDYGMFGIVVNKLRESIIAERLEDIYSKKEILGLYFNTVPFSDHTFGIESAAQKFFNRSASDLTLEQAATLVGTLKASHYYNPRLFPDRSIARRNVVLGQMKKYDFLSPEKFSAAKNTPLALDYQFFDHNSGVAPYFRSQLKKDLENLLDSINKKRGTSYNIYRDGLQVHTTLDYDMQRIAEEAVSAHMSDLQEKFEQAYGSRAPWKNKSVLKEVLKASPQYKSLQKSGWKEKEIMDSLHRKKDMELFEWGKKKMVSASIADSLQHYMKFLNIGMVNLDPSTGAIKTWVGGINHKYFKYDHVSQSERQIGSTFKPVVYSAAVESGMDPCSYFSVREVTYGEGWTPSNSGREEDPHMNYPMETALSRSINTIAVKVLFEAGLGKVLSMAKGMGFPSDLPPYPSIALGTAEMSALELARPYTSFVNGGRTATPYFISEIRDKYGKTLIQFEPQVSEKRAFSESTRELILEMMKTTVNEGTANRLRYRYGLQNDIAGKTGTTQDNKDGWFVGLSPNLVSITWVGADDHRIGFPSTSMGQGANSALPAFALFMQELNTKEKFNEITNAQFTPPSPRVREMLDCDPMERDNFLERLFTKADQPKPADKKEKKGLFSKIKGLFKKNN